MSHFKSQVVQCVCDTCCALAEGSFEARAANGLLMGCRCLRTCFSDKAGVPEQQSCLEQLISS